jgi:hypothetical protein
MTKNKKSYISAIYNNFRIKYIIILEAEVKILSKLNLITKAVNDINLGAGFEVEAGGEFYANVSGDCPN